MRSYALLILALIVAVLMWIGGPLGDFVFAAGELLFFALVFGAIVGFAELHGGGQCNRP